MVDALREAGGQVIAGLHRQWSKQFEVVQAQLAQARSEYAEVVSKLKAENLELRVAARDELAECRREIATLQEDVRRRTDARLAELKDGIDGAAGPQGAQGEAGPAGPAGPQGPQGLAGVDGIDGKEGVPGLPGEKGEKGDAGLAGERGEMGLPGIPGAIGEKGLPGEKGEKGDRGEFGIPGTPGERGERGEKGIQGEAGIGIQGERGEKGEQGAIGERGAPGESILGPRGEKGDKGDIGLPGIPGAVGAAGPQGERGERGAEGAPGKIDKIAPWTDKVFYEGDLVTHNGETYQAQADTAREPGKHVDWLLLAAKGADGREGIDGRSFRIRGTYNPNPDEPYEVLDVVTLNHVWFVARGNDPGPCPGPGWQTGPMGKRGEKGERGPAGMRGEKGAPSQGIIDWRIHKYKVFPVLEDGSEGAPLDSRVLFERFHEDAG